MQENHVDYKELIETFDIYYNSLFKIKKIINEKKFNSHFSSISIDEILESSKIKNKEIKLKTCNKLI